MTLVWFALFLNAIGYIWQTKAIVNNRSGEAVSLAWFASSLGLEIVNVIYGISHSDAFFLTNAILCVIGQVIVLVALRIYKPLGKREKVVITAMLATIVSALLLPFQNHIQMTAQIINFCGGVDQPLQLKAARGTGSLEFMSLLLSGISSAIWTDYCWNNFGFWGPAAGYLVYTVYCGYMLCLWITKARSAKSL